MYETYDQRYCPFLGSPASIPRSHYYPASDGSDGSSPGGGGSFGSSGSIFQSNHQQTEDQGLNHERSQEDTPFIPSDYAISGVQSTAGRGLARPSEYQLPNPLHSATPSFSGDAQPFGSHVGQYPHYQDAHHQSQSQSLGAGYGHLQHEFGLSPSPQPGSRRHHQQQQHQYPRIETSTSSSPGSVGSSAFASPTVAPTALQLHGISEPTYPDAGRYLRHQLGLSPDAPVNLDCLPDPPAGRKPFQAYPILIKLAIYGSPQKKLTLNGIYEAIENRFEYFKNNNTGAWKRSIRHNLSLNQVFRNVPRPITEPGKGSYWVLDISGGEGYKRERKRRNKKAQRQARAAQGRESESESVTGDEEGGSDTSSICRSESPSTRATHLEMGPSRTSLRRHGSPYAQSEGSSARVPGLSRGLYSEPGRTSSPWNTGPTHQSVQGQYHQPQPLTPTPFPFYVAGQPGPVLPAIGWHTQPQMRQHERSPGVSSQMPYASSTSTASSSMGGNQGQVHAVSPTPHAYGTAFQGSQSGTRGGQFQGMGGEQTLEDHNTESAFPRQGSQGDRRYYGL